jgi:hypothetical protein
MLMIPAGLMQRVLLGALAVVTSAYIAAFAQAGSIGGTLGNSDKSISGERREEPAAPASPHRQHTPADTRANTKSAGGGCGPILGKWLFSNGVTVIVNANKTTTQSDGFSATVSCADGVYTFTWPLGSAHMTLSANGRTMSGMSSLGPGSASRL